MKRLFPALKEAQQEFPHDRNHQRLVARDIAWWTAHANDPNEHRRHIVKENTERGNSGLGFLSLSDDPYWECVPGVRLAHAERSPGV